MPPVTTSQRTYRYLRLALAGAPLALLLSVALAAVDVGVLPTVSHYFYTSARTVFTSALVAAAACLLALSGRGLQRTLLDVAALLAPLIAIVPTPIAAGEVPGIDVACGDVCVPAPYDADIDNAVLTYLVVVALAVVIGLVLIVRGEVDGRATVPNLVVSTVVVAAVGLVWWWAREVFVTYAHVVAAFSFFAVIAAVAITEVVRPSPQHPPSPAVRRAYIALAAAMLLDLVATFALGGLVDLPVVFVGEVVALLLFFVFWLVQTRQKWAESNPSVRG